MQLQKILTQKDSKEKVDKRNDIGVKLQKIEKLSKDIEQLKNNILRIKQDVDTKASSAKNMFFVASENYLLALIKLLEVKSFTLWQKEIITDLIDEEISILQDMGCQSETFTNAVENYHKSQIEEFTDGDKEQTAEMMQSFFDSMGLEVNTDELDFENLTSNEFTEKMQEKLHEKRAEQQQNFKDKATVKKNANTDLDLQKLYKKLVKLIHPDLGQTQDDKELRNAKMKRLTAAWDNREYYTILELWLEFDPENTIGIAIDEVNKKSIIKELNEKIKDLEGEQYRIKHFYGDTSFIYQNFYSHKSEISDKKINNYVNDLNKTTQNVNKHHLLTKNTSAFKNYLKELYDTQMFGGDDDDDDFGFEEFMNYGKK